MKRGVEVAGVCDCGELGGLRSSLEPSIDDIEMPPDGRDEYEARSRAPAKGEAVGGPRGAPPGGSWGGEGGGIWRDWKFGGGSGDSRGPATVSVRPAFDATNAPQDSGMASSPWCGYCGGLAAPKDCRRETS